MDSVFYELPEAIISKGIGYEINTDFKVWTDIINYLSNEKYSEKDKLIYLISRGYKSNIPSDIKDATDGLLYFMSLGRMNEKTSGEQIIDYEKDEGMIYSAFMKEYHIDLYKENLHWWKFIYLLENMGEDTRLMRVIGYRTADISRIKDPEKKRFLRNMKRVYGIRKQISENEIADALGGVI